VCVWESERRKSEKREHPISVFFFSKNRFKWIKRRRFFSSVLEEEEEELKQTRHKNE